MVLPTDATDSFFRVELGILVGLSIAIVLLRCLVRVQATGLRKLELDDWGMNVAAILLVFTISAPRLIVVTMNIGSEEAPDHTPILPDPALANHAMTDEQRANLDPTSFEYQIRVASSKLHLTAWSLYVSTLWCLKLCIAVFYTRLTNGLSHMNIRVRIAYVAIGVTYVVVMAIILGACRPFNHHWQINPNPGDQCMLATSALICYTIVSLDVITDLYLLHIPILMFWDARIPRVKKVFLIMLFSGGVFVTLAAVLRAYLISTGGSEGGAEAAYWGVREIFVAFLIGNLPIIYGGGRIWLRKFKESRAYGRIRSMSKGRPGASRIDRPLSQADRSRQGTIPGDPEQSLSCATLNATESSHPSSLPWAHTPPGGSISTDARRSETPRAESDADYGIQVTRGIEVDFESVRNEVNDSETVKISGKHSQMNSKDQLDPSLTDLAPQLPSHGRIAELPAQERQLHNHYFPSDPQRRGSVTPGGPNGKTWFADHSP